MIEFFFAKHTHVKTGICVLFKNKKKFKIVSTKIKFKSLHQKEIDDYIKTNEWIDKAGSYAIQGYAERFIIKIIGSYSNVVGLPLYETINILISVKNF